MQLRLHLLSNKIDLCETHFSYFVMKFPAAQTWGPTIEAILKSIASNGYAKEIFKLKYFAF